MYKALGSGGYWLYYVCSLITLYGSNIGSMVVMADFLEAMPIGSNVKMRRLVSQIILTILCIILCELKDPKYGFAVDLTIRMLVGISSLGLFSIAAAFIVMIMYD